MPIIFIPRPKACDECSTPFPTAPGVVMVDGPSRGPGSPWGCFCWGCWQVIRRTYEFGPGHGQRYTQNEEQDFVLTDGGLEDE